MFNGHDECIEKCLHKQAKLWVNARFEIKVYWMEKLHMDHSISKVLYNF